MWQQDILSVRVRCDCVYASSKCVRQAPNEQQPIQVCVLAPGLAYGLLLSESFANLHKHPVRVPPACMFGVYVSHIQHCQTFVWQLADLGNKRLRLAAFSYSTLVHYSMQ